MIIPHNVTLCDFELGLSGHIGWIPDWRWAKCDVYTNIIYLSRRCYHIVLLLQTFVSLYILLI